MRAGGKAKPRTLETLQFTLELLKRIPRRPRQVSAPDLHAQLTSAGFQRDLRTVQRQLDELCECFDIERDDRSKPYGYQWKERAQGLSLPGLNEKESLLLALAQEHLRNLLPDEVLRSIQPFFEQARRNLMPVGAQGEAARAREWMRKVRVVSTSQPLLPPPIRPGVFEAVSTALYRDLWLDVHYRNSRDKEVHANVMPLGLAQQGTRLYLVCRFEGHDNERSLALNRLLDAKCTNRTFTRPAGFDLQLYDQDGRFGYGSGERIKLNIRIGEQAGKHLLESRLSQDQEVVEEEGHYVIRATVTKTEQLKWWLRGFGDEVEVLAPAELERALRSGGS